MEPNYDSTDNDTDDYLFTVPLRDRANKRRFSKNKKNEKQMYLSSEPTKSATTNIIKEEKEEEQQTSQMLELESIKNQIKKINADNEKLKIYVNKMEKTEAELNKLSNDFEAFRLQHPNKPKGILKKQRKVSFASNAGKQQYGGRGGTEFTRTPPRKNHTIFAYNEGHFDQSSDESSDESLNQSSNEQTPKQKKGSKSSNQPVHKQTPKQTKGSKSSNQPFHKQRPKQKKGSRFSNHPSHQQIRKKIQGSRFNRGRQAVELSSAQRKQ